MSTSNNLYTITEYGRFSCKTDINGCQSLPGKTFNALENFILANNFGAETEAVEFLSLSVRKGIGKIITARNYVGIISMNDGTVIEILPKIAGAISLSETRRIFIEMLRALKDVTFKEFNISNLHTDRLSIFEIFIKMFLDEVTILTKQGLKATYTPLESNERFYKGKLLASQNIKYNLVHKERFFVRYDDFNLNRPENRLIKSTLFFLLKFIKDGRNRQNAIRLLTFLEGVNFSSNYKEDFSKCVNDRSMSHYGKTISWCRVFLLGNSFTSFAGSEVAIALLFPMEKIFESFVEAKLRKHIGSDIQLRTQDSRFSLFDRPAPTFYLRPDLVLEYGEQKVVMDTKWKLLSGNMRYYGISQADMYQMYAYSKKYGAENVFLVYPYPEDASIGKEELCYSSDDGVNVNISFIDLNNVDSSIISLLDKC
ncbi:MAG: McrC family protein [Ruminococcaceae bacterium]|nr:McrC family protein [Oscillospiraceae bacterium]